MTNKQQRAIMLRDQVWAKLRDNEGPIREALIRTKGSTDDDVKLLRMAAMVALGDAFASPNRNRTQ